MIDTDSERLIPLRDAPRHVPPRADGRRVNISTIWRWADPGILGGSGERVPLEIVRIGGRVYTSTEAIKRFFVRLSGAEAPEPPRSTGERRRSILRAERVLDGAGVR